MDNKRDTRGKPECCSGIASKLKGEPKWHLIFSAGEKNYRATSNEIFMHEKKKQFNAAATFSSSTHLLFT
jgi:hypothetical protein